MDAARYDERLGVPLRWWVQGVMLVASLFVRPVLNHLGELHGLQHILQAAVEHGALWLRVGGDGP